MEYLKPKNKNNFLIVCESCQAIINFSREDCFCVKEIDRVAFAKGDFKNVSRVFIKCPNCTNHQDVIAGVRYVNSNDKWGF